MANCSLIRRRTLANQAEPQVTTHFTGRVRLARQPLRVELSTTPQDPAESIMEAAEIYRIYFHGPAYQMLERAWLDGDRILGQMALGLPANHEPAEQPMVLSPRVIELCFQTAGMWEIGYTGRIGLPQHVPRVEWFSVPDCPDRRLFAVVTPESEGRGFSAELVDSAGNRYLHLQGYRTVGVSRPGAGRTITHNACRHGVKRI